MIDISPDGALIETTHRLLPNALVDLHFETSDRRASLRGRLVRCFVASVRASSVRYRAGVQFEGSLADLLSGVDL